MNAKPYPNELLASIAEQIAEWELTDAQLAALAADLPSEVGAIMEAANEAAWERHYESSGYDDSSYRRDMIAAGRGHLLRDR